MELKKQFGKLEVFSIAAGGMISSGIFILPSIAFREAGVGVVLAYLFAGLLMLPALFSKMELATALPKAGGIYFFSERILGTGAGVVTGLASWFSLGMKSAFALIGIGSFATLINPHIGTWEVKIIASIAAVVFGVLNLLSVKSTGKIQIVMVFILLVILSLFVIVGYPQIDYSNFNFSSFTFDSSVLLATTGMVFISYGGLTKVAAVAEEVKDLPQNLVPGTFAGFIVIQILYVLVLFVMVGVMPADALSSSITPVTDASTYFFDNQKIDSLFIYITAGAGMLAFITTANAGILAASRNPLSMGRDGLLPDFISRISAKKGTPVAAVIFTTVFMIILILALPIVKLVKVASLFQLLLFIMVNISVIIIRSSKILNYKPSFKTPLYPVPQILGIILYFMLIIKMGTFTISVAAGFIAVCVAWYFVYAHQRVSRKSALVHTIERLANPEIIEDESEIELENELLDILVERNEIVEDRFDRLIRQAPVIDYKETITREQLFSDLAEIVSKKTGIEKSLLEKKFQLREDESSTLLFDGVALPHAVPHVIIEGAHVFDIILVRNKYGIVWNENNDIVYTAFSLIGSKDERNFHLKALAAFAQVLMDPDFEKEWTNAKNDNDLRTAVLLVKRKRQQKIE